LTGNHINGLHYSYDLTSYDHFQIKISFRIILQTKQLAMATS